MAERQSVDLWPHLDNDRQWWTEPTLNDPVEPQARAVIWPEDCPVPPSAIPHRGEACEWRLTPEGPWRKSPRVIVAEPFWEPDWLEWVVMVEHQAMSRLVPVTDVRHPQSVYASLDVRHPQETEGDGGQGGPDDQ